MKLREKRGVILGLIIRLLKFIDGRHKGLGDVLTAIDAVMSVIHIV